MNPKSQDSTKAQPLVTSSNPLGITASEDMEIDEILPKPKSLGKKSESSAAQQVKEIVNSVVTKGEQFYQMFRDQVC